MTKRDNVKPLRPVTWAAEFGSRRDLLVALRDRLWQALTDPRTQPRDLSPLTLRIKELEAEIRDIDHREAEDAARPGDETFHPEDDL